MNTIETNIPLPKRRANGPKARLNDLPVGGSFSFPIEKLNSIGTTIWEIKKTSKKRFTTSIEGQPEGFARVWRIDDAEEEA